MNEPQYDAEDMDRFYEFQEVRELRKRHAALIAELDDLVGAHMDSHPTGQYPSLCQICGEIDGDHLSVCWVGMVAAIAEKHR